jgi:hypothetical protein
LRLDGLFSDTRASFHMGDWSVVSQSLGDPRSRTVILLRNFIAQTTFS